MVQDQVLSKTFSVGCSTPLPVLSRVWVLCVGQTASHPDGFVLTVTTQTYSGFFKSLLAIFSRINFQNLNQSLVYTYPGSASARTLQAEKFWLHTVDMKPITSGSTAPLFRSYPDSSEIQDHKNTQAPEPRQILFTLIAFPVLQITPKSFVPVRIPSTACSW